MEAKIPIPKGWNKRVQSAILQAISLGRHCFVSIVARMANSPNAVDRIVAENEHLKHEVESLRVELRLKDARMARLPSQRRPHYSSTERLSILQLRASRGWNMAETADRFLLSPTTISSWMGRLDEGGESALVQAREPVNRFPDFVRYLVQWLKVMCPRLGKVKIAQILCRAGLHLGATTVGRMIKEPPPKFPQASDGPVGGPVVTAKCPDHVWHIDLSAVPISGGFWTTWKPFAVFPCWPFGWWVAVVLDHFSRRVQGFEVFDRRPDSQSITSLLDRVILEVGAKPKYLISDQEAQFVSDEMHEWCHPKGITQRFGAIGEHGSIAVLERLIQTMKVECTRLILIPFRRGAMVGELELFFDWYNDHRPHTTLQIRTPNEIYRDLSPACEQPRFEPRPRWRSTLPCASPTAPMESTSGAVHVKLEFLHGRKHLPVITLKRAA